MVCLCYDAIVRTTIDLSDDAYQIAKTVAREQNRSLGKVVSDFITRSAPEIEGSVESSDGLPTFRCVRRVQQ